MRLANPLRTWLLIALVSTVVVVWAEGAASGDAIADSGGWGGQRYKDGGHGAAAGGDASTGAAGAFKPRGRGLRSGPTGWGIGAA